MSVQASAAADSLVSPTLSPYSKFKMALKSKEVQRQYPNLLERFLVFCKIEVWTQKKRPLTSLVSLKSTTQEEVEDLIIRFVLFQKERIDKGEITSGTLRNYLKAVKLFCRMNRINMPRDIISCAVPMVKQHSNDRIPRVVNVPVTLASTDSTMMTRDSKEAIGL